MQIRAAGLMCVMKRSFCSAHDGGAEAQRQPPEGLPPGAQLRQGAVRGYTHIIITGMILVSPGAIPLASAPASSCRLAGLKLCSGTC